MKIKCLFIKDKYVYWNHYIHTIDSEISLTHPVFFLFFQFTITFEPIFSIEISDPILDFNVYKQRVNYIDQSHLSRLTQ